MSDETRRLKDEEQENWAWDFDSDNSDNDVASKTDVNEDDHIFGEPSEARDDNKLVKALLCALAVGVVIYAALTGFNFGSLSFGSLRGFWWLIFLIPMFTGNRSPNWVGLTFIFLLVTGLMSGTIWSMWWLVFLIPAMMGKRSRSC